MKHLFVLIFLCSTLWSKQAIAAVILQYHHVNDKTAAMTSVSAATFRQHLQYLKDHHFQVVSLPQLIDDLRHRRPIKDKTVVITFDDGYEDVYQQARPILTEFAWPYTVFVNPAAADAKYSQQMSWAQINQIASEKATIANHTNSHGYLARKPSNISQAQWLAQISEDIQAAEARIKTMTGQDHKMLAYPYGEFNLAVKNSLSELGYVGFGQHSGAVGQNTDLTRIPRFPASGIYADLTTLATKINSLPLAITELTNADPLISQNPPTLTVTLTVDDFLPTSLRCFALSEQATVIWLSDSQFSVTATQALPYQRSRYNCTAPSIAKPDRFYWFSQPWINLSQGG